MSLITWKEKGESQIATNAYETSFLFVYINLSKICMVLSDHGRLGDLALIVNEDPHAVKTHILSDHRVLQVR
jgi:hypothetical protein